MEHANKTVLDRLMHISKAKTYASLAKILDVTPQSVSDAKRKGRVPNAWILKISDKCDVSFEWLLYGDEPRQAPGRVNRYETNCINCVELYEKLVQSQEREIALIKENSELKAEIAALRAMPSLSPEGVESAEKTA
jgi:hypothetical protein